MTHFVLFQKLPNDDIIDTFPMMISVSNSILFLRDLMLRCAEIIQLKIFFSIPFRPLNETSRLKRVMVSATFFLMYFV